PSSSTERNLPCNTGGLVRAAWTDGLLAAPASMLYEHGDREWATKVRSDKQTALPAGTASSGGGTLKVELAPMADGRLRGQSRVAPSRAGAPAAVRLAQLVEGPRSAALQRG